MLYSGLWSDNRARPDPEAPQGRRLCYLRCLKFMRVLVSDNHFWSYEQPLLIILINQDNVVDQGTSRDIEPSG